MKTATKTHELKFTTDRINQGQMVTVSWATTKRGAVIECHEDSSDRSVHFYNQKTKKRLSTKQLERYGLTERN